MLSCSGTIFLWMFWPSFNSALAVGNEQHRSVINTFSSLLASCVVTFALSALMDEEGRISMVKYKDNFVLNSNLWFSDAR